MYEIAFITLATRMATTLVNPMPPFDPDAEIGVNLAPKWKIWLQDFEMYLVASGVTDKKKKRALLLYQAGPRVREIFRQIPDHGDDDDFDTAVNKLNAYFEPQKHRLYDVYQFRQAKQVETETLDQYYTRLRSLSKNCDFHDPDFEIMVQIVLYGTSSRLRKQALRDPKISLETLLITGRQLERSHIQARHIEEKVHIVEQDPPVIQALNDRRRTRTVANMCRNCGGEWPHTNNPCPAKNKECRKCKKLNHFARVCRSGPKESPGQSTAKLSQSRGDNVRPVNTSDLKETSSESSDSEYCYAVNTKQSKSPITKLTINNQKVTFTVDTGSTINIIDENTFNTLGHINLKKTNIKAYPFNSTESVKMKGKFQTLVESRKRITVATIYVTEQDGGCLLGNHTAQELGLISLHLNKIGTSTNFRKQNNITNTHPVKDKIIQNLLSKHQRVFEGTGKLQNRQVELIVDRSVKPVVQRQRRIPFHLRAKVDSELERLEAEDIIEKVPDTEETPWISPVVIVPKKEDKIRLCVDMRAANKAIKRVCHPIPTVRDISMDLNGAKFFSKLDMSQAYHQLELAPSSRNITTFITHAGLYRFKRLNYGTNSAAEIFQNTLQQVLHGINGVRNIADDILIYGTTYEEHNKALKECLQRLELHGLTLNLDKCRFLKNHLEFFGLLFSHDGVRPDPKKISAFYNTTIPTTVGEVRSLLGMANYSSQFIPNFATITEPLRRLTHKEAKFIWGKEQEDAYQKLKTALVNSPVMGYFDTKNESELIVDASPVGLSAILTQKLPGENASSKIIAYASRALTPTEQRYCQTEKEALAIVWGIEYFHLYLYGAPFTLYTDHKALELIFTNPLSKPPARIERWLLRLQEYDFNVLYTAGNKNPADFLSRHPTESRKSKHNIAEEYINFVITAAVPHKMNVEEIIQATDKDEALIALKNAVTSGSWDDPKVKPYRMLKDEITIDHNNKILLRGTRIIIPASLQKRTIQIAHEGHQGQARTKALLRETVWFPGMDEQVRTELEHCLACQATAQPNHPEPIKTAPMPNRPWDKVKIDFYGPLPTGQYILVVIDCYSRFPEIEILATTSAQKVIPKLDSIFARHGIPSHLTSDNGPPFQSHEFGRYMTAMGITHTTSTPLWPQGNAEVEAFMKPLGKAIKTAHLERRPWQQELSRFLLAYRSTPHSTTKVPPAQLLYNREMRGKLPSLPRNHKIVNRHREAKENQIKAKDKGKEYADQRRATKSSNIKVGDTVLVKQKKKNKLSTNFATTPYTVISINGSTIVAGNKDHRITRNSSFFRKIPSDIESEEEESVISQPHRRETRTGHREDRTGIPEQQDEVMPPRRSLEQQNEVTPARRSTRERTQTEFFGNPITFHMINYK